MKIDYLDTILSACLTLRKMKTLIIQENKGEFSMRPQLHVLIVSPFGTFKSSLTKQLEKKYPKFVYPVDDFTKPGIEGSISRDGEYVPPLILKLGGKVLIIDEWNNVDYFAQGSLLGLLENQRFSRIIGFKVKKDFKFSNKYGAFSIIENIIEGDMLFSCLAYAMEYPISSQKEKALISRFTPLFLQPTIEYMKSNTRGDFEVKIEDYSQEVENVLITKECYEKFHTEYFNFIEMESLIPEDTDDYGYLARVMSDIIRLGVFHYLKINKVQGKSLIISEPSYFTEQFSNVHTLLQQFANPKTKGKYDQYRALLKQHPGRKKEFYYQTLGITRETLYQYDKKIGEKIDIEVELP